MTKNQTALVQKITRLKSLEKQMAEASILQQGNLARAAMALSIQIFEHVALEVVPNGQ